MIEGGWFVYDPDPIPEWYPAGGPILVGPFDTREAADTHANEAHPEDMSGNTVVLQAGGVPTYTQLEQDCEATALQRDARNASLRRIRAAAESDADLAKLPALRDFLLRETADAPTLPDVIEGHVPAGVPGGGRQEQDLGGTAVAVPSGIDPEGEA